MTSTITKKYKQNVIILNTTDASYSSIGSLLLYGGLNIASTANSTDICTGSAIIHGGMGISGKLHGKYANYSLINANLASMGSIEITDALFTTLSAASLINTDIVNITNTVRVANGTTVGTLTALNVNITTASFTNGNITNATIANILHCTIGNIGYISVGNTLRSDSAIVTVTYNSVQNSVSGIITVGSMSVADTQNVSNGSGPFTGQTMLVEKSLFIGGDLNISGSLTVNGSTTSINSTQANVSDNLIVLNASSNNNTANFVDSGFLIKQYSSIIGNYVADYYDTTNKAYTFAHTNTSHGSISVEAYTNLIAKDVSLNGNLNVTGGSNMSNVYMTNANSVALLNAVTTQRVTTNNLIVSDTLTTNNLVITGVFDVNNTTIPNAVVTYATLGNITMNSISAGTLKATNATFGNLYVNSVQMLYDVNDIIQERTSSNFIVTLTPLPIDQLILPTSMFNVQLLCYDSINNYTSLYDITGIRNSGEYYLNTSYIGDDVFGLEFTCDAIGQLYYTSPTYAGSFGFRAKSYTAEL